MIASQTISTLTATFGSPLTAAALQLPLNQGHGHNDGKELIICQKMTFAVLEESFSRSAEYHQLSGARLISPYMVPLSKEKQLFHQILTKGIGSSVAEPCFAVHKQNSRSCLIDSKEVNANNFFWDWHLEFVNFFFKSTHFNLLLKNLASQTPYILPRTT